MRSFRPIVADHSSPKAALRKGLFKPWINGLSAEEPEMQVQQYDPDTYVIRQSVKTNFEAPFLYLFFGSRRAILFDTGAGGLNIRPTIERIIADWLKAHGRESIPLVVAHTHSDLDHIQGDAEFVGRPQTFIVGWTASLVSEFFNFKDWPKHTATYDLGGRLLHLIPTPGHHPSHIMIYDEKTELLISGDTLYAGRIYVPLDKSQIFRDSINRVIAFSKNYPIRYILGSHIEMTTTPGEDFGFKAEVHPNEHSLELYYEDLLRLQEASAKLGNSLDIDRQEHFIIFRSNRQVIYRFRAPSA